MVQLTFLYFCLPTLLLAAPIEDALKQQIASGLSRNDEAYWNMLNPAGGRPLRRLDSLGGESFGLQKKFDSISGSNFGSQKRNFDEIDNVGMGFRKRNFDEIDNAGFGAFL